jgi:hypothetical protein
MRPPRILAIAEIPWKERNAALQGLHVSLFQLRCLSRWLKAPMGDPTMNRILNTAIAAATALSMACAAQAATETKPKKEPSAAQLAARERMSKCSLEWKEAKAGGKIEAGMKWPKYWSACNKRLKDGAKA